MSTIRVSHLATTVHGRVLVESPAEPIGALIGFHGYAQTADDMIAELQQIPGAEAWTKVSIQALHSFYIRGDSKVVASWMTRQDRDLAIADNVAYVTAAIDRVLMEHAVPAHPSSDRLSLGRLPSEHAGFSPRDSAGSESPALRVSTPLVMVGFSQGAAMAYRAALHSPHPVSGIVALGGDIPPELKDDESRVWPRVLIGVGDREEWYAGEKLENDLAFLKARGITHQLVRFDGGHEWTAAFREAVGGFLPTESTDR